MAGREHGAGAVQQSRREVELVGRRQPDLYHIEALRVTPRANAAARDGELGRMS